MYTAFVVNYWEAQRAFDHSCVMWGSPGRESRDSQYGDQLGLSKSAIAQLERNIAAEAHELLPKAFFSTLWFPPVHIGIAARQHTTHKTGKFHLV